MDKDDEERIQQAIEQQIERALASKKDVSRRNTVDLIMFVKRMSTILLDK